MKFCFASPLEPAWGETVLGARIARALVKRGHRVVFGLPRAVHRILEEVGASVGVVDPERGDLTSALTHLVHRSRSETLVLVDEFTWSRTLALRRTSPRFLDRLGIRIVALDVWDVSAHRRGWDAVPRRFRVRPLEPVTARLRPTPFLGPRGDGSSYCALPSNGVRSARANRRARAASGLSAADRLVVTTTASWQLPENVSCVPRARLARTLPYLVAALLGRVGERLVVAHVGPTPLTPLAMTLERRYRWYPQMSPPAFEELLGGADAFLSFNAASTASITAISLGVPVLTGVLSHRIASVAHLRRLVSQPSDFLESWTTQAIPLSPFAVWPVGFCDVMHTVLSDNPYRALLHLSDVVDEHGFVAALHALLYDARVRQTAGDRATAYRNLVRGLPDGADLLEAAAR